MSLDLDNVIFIGRTYDEYIDMFNLHNLKNKKVLDFPAGACSFSSQNNSYAADILYDQDKEDLEIVGKKSINLIYKNIDWINSTCTLSYYKDIFKHKAQREEALNDFLKDYSKERYSKQTLPNSTFKDKEFDLLLSAHFLFTYDDRFSYEFHKKSVFEMLRVSKEVRIFPLVDMNNSNLGKQRNFSPYLYRLLEELEDYGYSYSIEKSNYEFQLDAGYFLKINS